MAAELNGPQLEPRGPARALVVFLHGYGADGNDLIEIGRAWQVLLPHAAFVSPHAPEPCGQAPVGRQWFPLTFRDPNERWLGCNKAAPVLENFLSAELKRRNLRLRHSRWWREFSRAQCSRCMSVFGAPSRLLRLSDIPACS